MCILRLRNHLCRTALVYVSNKRGFPGRHHNSIHRLLISFVQTVSTSRVSIVFSRYFQELVPHLFTEQSLGPNVACSKRSDSGERCGVEKAMKSRGGLGREVREVRFPLSPLLLPRFYFFALPFTLHRSPLSERLEQARPNVSVISKKRKRKTRTVFSRFNSLFCPLFFKESENF